MRGLIDWSLLAELQSPPALGQPAMWDAFAARYDGYGRLQQPYTQAQVGFMALQPHETLLDVGAGAGRISIAAAPHAREVTALDTSRGMLDALARRAREAGCRNVRPLHLPWEQVVPGRNLEPHDVVLASRSPAMSDQARLDALARRAVYVMLYSGPSLKQFHDRLVEGIEPFPSAGPRRPAIDGHALVFNHAVSLGFEPRVDYLDDGFHRRYRDEDEAVADLAWLNLPAGSTERLRHNLRPFLHADGDGLLLRLRSRSAVVWWPKLRPALDAL